MKNPRAVMKRIKVGILKFIFIYLLISLYPHNLSEAQEPLVEVTLEQQRIVGIKTSKVAYIDMKRTIKTAGIVQFDESLTSTINIKIEGWIEKLHVNTTGRYINKGEPLAEIYSPELLSAQEELLSALRLLKKAQEKGSELLINDARKIYEAARQRLLYWDIPQEKIEDIEKNNRPLRTLTILSPQKGYVIQKYAVEGMRVMPGERLFDIADLERVWIIADVYEADIALLQSLKSAEIRLSHIPSRVYRAPVDYIYPVVNESTRTLKVRFLLPNQGHLLRPGMFTDILIKTNLGRRLAIPEDAVIDTGLRTIVYVRKSDEEFEPREILTGLSADGMREVIRGLKPGEEVVSQATFLIDSEARLKGIKPLPLK
ncbi:MAG: efflux RND transporter periplasmic adaptor subunit [Thermodesulfovibrionales bacterium]|nr:efflux RND transporter periplasmic adaptor subunit [Thermodesulfovibrionales bacterium]